jgi:hypothetical protein
MGLMKQEKKILQKKIKLLQRIDKAELNQINILLNFKLHYEFLIYLKTLNYITSF